MGTFNRRRRNPRGELPTYENNLTRKRRRRRRLGINWHSTNTLHVTSAGWINYKRQSTIAPSNKLWSFGRPKRNGRIQKSLSLCHCIKSITLIQSSKILQRWRTHERTQTRRCVQSIRYNEGDTLSVRVRSSCSIGQKGPTFVCNCWSLQRR